MHKFLSVKDKWYLALVNIPLFFLFAYLASVVGNILLKEGELKSLVLGLVPTAVALNAIKDLISAFFRIKEDAVKRVLTAWGQMTILVALVFANLVTGVGYIHFVGDPCYGITRVKYGKPVVLFAKFQLKGTEQNPEVNWWPERLRTNMVDTIGQLDLKLVELPPSVVIDSDEKAQVQNECYNAILTLWGNEDSKHIEVNYAVSSYLANFINPPTSYMQGSDVQKNPSQGMMDSDSFAMYIENGGDTEYVVSVLTGTLQHFNVGVPVGTNSNVNVVDSVFQNMDQKQKEAIALFTHAINIVPKERADNLRLKEVYMLRGESYRYISEDAKAADDYTEAIKLGLKSSQVYWERGGMYLSLEKYAKAADDYTEAIKLGQADMFTYHNRGIAYSNLEQYDKAIEDFTEEINQVVSADQAYGGMLVLAYSARGNAYAKIGKDDKAISDFTKSIDQGWESRNVKTYRLRGLSYLALKMYPEALSDFRTYVSMAETPDPIILQTISEISLKIKLGIKQ